MNAAEVDNFLGSGSRSLPAMPEWRTGNRTGERRASVPILHNGRSTPVTVEITVRLLEADYLMILLKVGQSVICRLCMTTGHTDRLTKQQINQAHFHCWEANRGTLKNIPKKLNQLELIPPSVTGRDSAFIWFLQRNGIELPSWFPPAWPHGNML